MPAPATTQDTQDNIIIDELHLMLCVMDWLETGLILEVLDWDEVESIFILLTNFALKKVYVYYILIALP